MHCNQKQKSISCSILISTQTHMLVDFNRAAVARQFLIEPKVGGEPEFAAAAAAVGG